MKPEGGHWYTKDGQPMHFVPRASGSGTRPTTIHDARKLGLVPSVTKVIGDVLRKPGLEKYMIEQAVLAVVTAPDRRFETLDQKIYRVLEEEGDADAKAARDRGSAIHEALELRLSGQPCRADIEPWIAPAIPDLQALGHVESIEKVVIGDGYGGKVDLIIKSPEGIIVIDHKTARKLPEKGSWFEHRLQLAAYAAAIDKQQPVSMVGNMYISTLVAGERKLYTWPDWQNDYVLFRYVLELWQAMNNYES